MGGTGRPTGCLLYTSYRRRNEIERLFRRLKGYRRVFCRYDKLDVVFTGFIVLALIAEGLRVSVNRP